MIKKNLSIKIGINKYHPIKLLHFRITFSILHRHPPYHRAKHLYSALHLRMEE